MLSVDVKVAGLKLDDVEELFISGNKCSAVFREKRKYKGAELSSRMTLTFNKKDIDHIHVEQIDDCGF